MSNFVRIEPTRRSVLKRAGLFASASGLIAQSQSSRSNRRLSYIASYSSPQGPEGSKGYGKGIYLFEMDPATGTLAQRDLFPNDSNPSWLAFDSSRTHLYSANETANYGGEKSGSVSAYAIDRPTGRLTLLNTESSHGASPCYVSVHPSGKHALVANYHGGTIAVLPILAGGRLGPATDVKSAAGQPAPSMPRARRREALLSAVTTSLTRT